ncbi:MAG: hypothetical protein ACFFBD_26435 [Candidatus Hodarchaeota archaeon]
MQRIKVFQDLGDNIANIIKRENDDRLLKKIEYARSFNGFRFSLLQFNQKAIKIGLKQPLVTLETYFQDLFPKGHLSWKETRDILLFRIYEALHSWLIEQGYEVPDSDEEDESEESSIE